MLWIARGIQEVGIGLWKRPRHGLDCRGRGIVEKAPPAGSALSNRTCRIGGQFYGATRLKPTPTFKAQTGLLIFQD